MREELDIRRVHASDGARLRAIRLSALSDPAARIAFSATWKDAEAQPRSFWDERAIGAALSDQVAQFIAEDGARWVGTVAVLLPETKASNAGGGAATDGQALLVAVYVEGPYRGRGVIDALIERAALWAAERGRSSLSLDVHRDNHRAQAAYRRMGFTSTGATFEGPNGPEQQMVLPLPLP